MPVTPTYPGVYIEEIPSSVRTIIGVATSITAFVGRAPRGPVDRAVTINSFGDYERLFGGLALDSPMSFAVRDFYRHGGSQAIIVRVFNPSEADQAAMADAANDVANAAAAVPDAGTPADVVTAARGVANDPANAKEPRKSAADAVAAAAEAAAAQGGATVAAVKKAAADAVAKAAPPTRAELDLGGLGLRAAYPGGWGNELRARVDHTVNTEVPQAVQDKLFNLHVRDGTTGEIELFRNVSVTQEHVRYVWDVLRNESRLVRATAVPGARPNESGNVVDKGNTIWDDNQAPTNTKVGTPVGDGNPLTLNDFTGNPAGKRGLYALEEADLFNLLCIPPYTAAGNVDSDLITDAADYCEDRRAMLLLDPPSGWKTKDDAKANLRADIGTTSQNAALFFPRLKQANPLRGNQLEEFVPCGAVAGIFAATDTRRGVWKAPAGLEATLNGVRDLTVTLTDAENGELNPLGINCLRTFNAVGQVVWGARTRRGADTLASEWKYIPVRRLALFIEESLYRGTQWVVFEPNDEPLWAAIRLNVGAFMNNLFRQGAFQGRTPREAYFVKCDRENNPQNTIDQGIVYIRVGFAPLKPAEFVIVQIQQLAGQLQV